MDVGTQTEKSYVRNLHKVNQDPVEEAKPPVQEAEVLTKIKSCEFEVFGIVQGLF